MTALGATALGLTLASLLGCQSIIGIEDGAPLDIAYLPEEAETLGTTDLLLDVSATLDTSELELNGREVPEGVIFDTASQDAGASAPQLAVLRVRNLTIAAGVTITVVGDRPLFILATETIDIAGTLDGAANGQIPGPGGGLPGEGEGVGGIGEAMSDCYSGGGGAGHATGGAVGGDSECNGNRLPGGLAGIAHGSQPPTVIHGGSGGGRSRFLFCPEPKGGAGGGAIVVHARESIVVAETGGINVGGGGGMQGFNCSGPNNAGAGGGSGGTLVLQGPRVLHAGVLAANGGGGGGSSGDQGSGEPGQNGQLSGDPTPGGDPGAGERSAPGGTGGALGANPQPGGDSPIDGSDGGGGGAGAGRIVIMTESLDRAGAVISPEPHVMPYQAPPSGE